MSLFGSISIEVGANLAGLKVGMSESLKMLDNWGDKAKSKTDSLWKDFASGMSGIWKELKTGLKDNLFETFDLVAGGLRGISDAIGKLKGPLSILPQHTQNNINAFAALADKSAGVVGGLAAVGDTLKPLAKMFPALAAVGVKSMGVLWTAISGPIGWISAAVIALGVVIYNNMDASIKIITGLANAFILAYNKSLFLRTSVEALLLPFKDLIAIGQSIGRLFSDGFENAEVIFFDLKASLAKIAADSADNIKDGLKPISPEDAEKFLRPIQTIGDGIKNIWNNLGADDAAMQDALNGLSKLSTGFDDLNKKAKEFKFNPFGEDKIEDVKFFDDESNPFRKMEPLIKSFTTADLAAREMGKGINRVFLSVKSTAGDTFKEISDAVKQFSNDVGQGLAGIFVNIFDKKDTGRLKDLNEELKEQKKILKDKSADKDIRDAAKARINLIHEEIAAEKDKANIIVQAGSVIIDAVKKQIGAYLANAIAALIPSVIKSIPFPFNMLAVGGAVAALSGLFKSKVPKLAQGGILTGRTLFEGGEYPGAANNPEVVAPLDKLTGYMKRAMPNMSRQQLQPVIVGGVIENIQRGEDIYQIVRLQHQRTKRTTGINYFE